MSSRYFLHLDWPDAISQCALRLKSQLSNTLFYAEQEILEGDHLWVRLARTWNGAAIGSGDIEQFRCSLAALKET